MAAHRHFLTLAALLAVAILTLGACSPPPTWHKDGTDEMSMQRDLSVCRQQAQAMYGPPGAIIGGGSQIDARFGPTGPSPADQAMREGQSIAGCMRGKGYALRAADAK